jgi:hypothetical protein
MLSGLFYFILMSWTVNDIMLLYQTLTNKNQAGGISAKKLFYTWNTEQNMYWQDEVGRWQARNNGKTGMNTGLIQDQTILTDLSPFTIPETITITSGKATKPDDFLLGLDLRINGVSSFAITHDQISSVNASVIDPPSSTGNVFYHTEYEDYYYILPQSFSGTLDLDYLAQPLDVKWGFTFDDNGRQVYYSGTSVQPKWKTPTIIEITKRALTNLGVSWKDADFVNYGRTAQTTGD